MQIIGNYQLISKLGEGGYATVWSATDRRNGAEVALKVLRPELTKQQPKSGPGPVQRFLAEAELLMRLDHPGMIKVLDYINKPQDGTVAFAMERLVGSDLYQLSRFDRIELPLLLEVLAQVATTLGHLHEHGIIHRDVKQSNIFVCEPFTHGDKPVSRLLDFGIAKQIDEESEQEHTRQGSMVGTSHLITPEVLDRATGQDVTLTGAVDQWGLGVVLYKCLTGKYPFNSEDYATLLMKIRRWPPPVMVLKKRFNLEKVPGVLDNIIRRALAKKPEERFSSAQSMAKYLWKARTEIIGEKEPVQDLTDTTQLVWSGPTGPLNLDALNSHRGVATKLSPALDDDAPTTLQSNPLRVIDAATSVDRTPDANTISQVHTPQTLAQPSQNPYPGPPVESIVDDFDSKATELQRSPLLESVKLSDHDMKMETAPLPSISSTSSKPQDQKISTEAVPYQIDSARAIEAYKDSSNWVFILIIAMVTLAFVILYFLFSA